MNVAHAKLIKERYENAVHEYCHAFCEKHGYHYDPDGWVGGNIGTIVLIGDYYINFDEIRYDIDNDVPAEIFIKYYDYSLEIASLDGGTGKMKQVNYPHYIMGYRPYSEMQLKEIREAKKRVDDANKALCKCVEDETGEGICGGCIFSTLQPDGNYCRCRRDGKFHKCYDKACGDYAKGGEV